MITILAPSNVKKSGRSLKNKNPIIIANNKREYRNGVTTPASPIRVDATIQ
jgi:hypothetical protein